MANGLLDLDLSGGVYVLKMFHAFFFLHFLHFIIKLLAFCATIVCAII